MAVLPRVFIDFSIEDQPLGRVIFELFTDTAPRTSENFRALCTGEKGISPTTGHALHYKGSPVHRVIAGFMVQAGDFTKGNGTGGQSIFGGNFEDEDLSRPVDKEGLLCMANKGPHTNGSQIFITLAPSSHLTGKHVVFGRVVRGFEDVVRAIEKVPTDGKDRPVNAVVISGCGELVRVAKETVPETRRRSLSRSPSPKRKRSHSNSPSRSRSRSPSRKSKKSKKSKKKSKKSKRDASPSPNATTHDPATVQDTAANGEKAPHKETEDEYDARLEREENERIEKERREVLVRIRDKYASGRNGDRDYHARGRSRSRSGERRDRSRSREAGGERHGEKDRDGEREKEREDKPKESNSNGGVRFKGRGRMKYIDPELGGMRY